MSPIRIRMVRAGMQLALYGTGASVWAYDAMRLAHALHP
jgi:hypothetical protein